MSIAFLGLGNMGAPMAVNLVKAGRQVVGYDPSAKAAAAARGSGLTVADTLAEAVTGAELVITMLPSGQHVLDCYRDVLPLVAGEALLVDCSTIDVTDARAAAELAAQQGKRTADAPVSGGVVGAEAASLTFMVGAEPRTYAEALPYLEQMGARAIHCGASGAGQAAKMCNNMILGVSMIAVAEAFVLAEKLGLTHQALFDVASTASGQCWSLTTNCPVPGPVPTSPANRDYAAGFASGLMLKDLRLAGAAAAEHGVASLLGARAEQLYTEFVDADGPHRDFSAIISAVRDGRLGTEATA